MSSPFSDVFEEEAYRRPADDIADAALPLEEEYPAAYTEIGVSRPVLGLPGCITETGLQLPDNLTFEEWLHIGETLKRLEKSVMWWIGDWLRYGERKWGEMYTQALDATGHSYQVLANAKWVADKFSCRHENLTWSHHLEAARLPEEKALQVLEEAAKNEWSTREVREQVNRIKNAVGLVPCEDTCTVADLAALTSRGRTFGTVYADPPWLYGNQGTRAATGNHYGGMTVEEIAALPVRELAAPDAHLHLWTTNAFLFDARAIMEAWGFEYKSVFVWVKPQMGIGNYWRVSHEFLLFGIRGSAPFRDRGQKSWMEADRTEHSAKPEQVRRIIESVSPGPYLELFGRRISAGWTTWGNQISRNIFDHDTPELTK